MARSAEEQHRINRIIVKKWKAKCKHFITAPTFQDLITGLEEMVHYLVQCATKYKDCDIAPWHFVSDSCEQLFAFLCTGFHKGCQTNLSSASVVHGAARKNRCLELDAKGSHLVAHDVAHTRGKTLIPNPNQTRVYKGRDTRRHQPQET